MIDVEGAARSPWTVGGGVIVAGSARPAHSGGGLIPARPGCVPLPPSRQESARPAHSGGGLIPARPGCVPLPPSCQETSAHVPGARSEERRVGKECRSRWSPYH